MTEVKAKNDGVRPNEVEAFVQAIYEAYRFAYSYRRKNTRRNVPWNGPDLELSGHLISDRLKRHTLRDGEVRPDHDLFSELVMIAIEFGVELGQRSARETPEMKLIELIARLDDGHEPG